MKTRWIQPDGSEFEKEVGPEGPNWQEMRQFFGDYVEHVSVLYQGKRCSMFVAESGMINQLPINDKATDIYWANMRAQGCEPTDPESLDKFERNAVERMAAAFGHDGAEVNVIKLGAQTGPSRIHGPAVVCDDFCR